MGQVLMNRIEKLFQDKQKNILSIFLTAGFPELNSTPAIAKQLEEAGVDLIEIGIPFSDPVADGPTIQESNSVALKNGMTVKLLLNQIKEIRKNVSIPIILMGYLNPVMQYGFEKFCKEAAANGVDGLILPDLPLDEYAAEYKKHVESAGLSISFLISPTTSETRIRKIDELSTGFVYAVSSSSTTGAKHDFTDEQVAYFKKIKDFDLKNPFLVGFGISSNQTFTKVSQYAAGAIVGSAFINFFKSGNSVGSIREFIRSIRP
jgi:tryptophan synthase alpha chain